MGQSTRVEKCLIRCVLVSLQKGTLIVQSSRRHFTLLNLCLSLVRARFLRVCGILLKLVKSFAPNVHYSFGDSGDKEKPHIVIPAWSFFERLVVTKPGEEIPILGEEFVEPKESVAARKAFKSKPQWNTEDTYSMSFYSMYMDFAKWQIVQLPVGDVDLKTFWGKSSLTIVLYENETPPKDDRHLQLDNKYYFGIQVSS